MYHNINNKNNDFNKTPKIKMGLTQIALDKIKANQRLRNRLAYVLDISSQSMYRHLKDNNILLTTAIALKVITEETGMPMDEILDKTNVFEKL